MLDTATEHLRLLRHIILGSPSLQSGGFQIMQKVPVNVTRYGYDESVNPAGGVTKIAKSRERALAPRWSIF
jgi:hypothetical protein